MKKYLKISGAIIILAAAGIAGLVYFPRFQRLPKDPEPVDNSQPKTTGQKSDPDIQAPKDGEISQLFLPPLSGAKDRITKKPFGLKVSPDNSPVSPERFSGYHTGTDFETAPDEQNKEVIVNAICGGRIIYKNWVSGYGGVIIKACLLNGQPVTVLYGHLAIGGGIAPKIGENMKAGDQLSVLGAAYSRDTDGERKHLHLGIHEGKNIELRGYVADQSELNSWLDPERYINFN